MQRLVRLSSLHSCTTEHHPEQEVHQSKTPMAKLQYKDIKEYIDLLESHVLIQGEVQETAVALPLDVSRLCQLSMCQRTLKQCHQLPTSTT